MCDVRTTFIALTNSLLVEDFSRKVFGKSFWNFCAQIVASCRHRRCRLGRYCECPTRRQKLSQNLSPNHPNLRSYLVINKTTSKATAWSLANNPKNPSLNLGNVSRFYILNEDEVFVTFCLHMKMPCYELTDHFELRGQPKLRFNNSNRTFKSNEKIIFSRVTYLLTIIKWLLRPTYLLTIIKWL